MLPLLRQGKEIIIDRQRHAVARRPPAGHDIEQRDVGIGIAIGFVEAHAAAHIQHVVQRRVAIAAARQFRHIARQRRLRIEHAVMDKDAADRRHQRFRHRLREMLGRGRHVVEIEFGDDAPAMHDDEAVGVGFRQHLRQCPGRTVHGRKAHFRQVLGLRGQRIHRPGAARHRGGGQHPPHILERPAVVGRQIPIVVGRTAIRRRRKALHDSRRGTHVLRPGGRRGHGAAGSMSSAAKSSRARAL